jgi:hypothetical protein
MIDGVQFARRDLRRSTVLVSTGRTMSALEVSCFVPLRVVAFSYGRYVGLCRYSTESFLRSNTSRSTLARSRVVPAQARPSKYLC